MAVVIYTRQFCSYCYRAKRLLDHLAVPYQEIAIDRDPQAFEQMRRAAGSRTVPQIWVGETHVGGCDELTDLHQSGKFVALLDEYGVPHGA